MFIFHRIFSMSYSTTKGLSFSKLPVESVHYPMNKKSKNKCSSVLEGQNNTVFFVAQFRTSTVNASKICAYFFTREVKKTKKLLYIE